MNTDPALFPQAEPEKTQSQHKWPEVNSGFERSKDLSDSPGRETPLGALSALWSLESIKGQKPAAYDAKVVEALADKKLIETLSKSEYGSNLAVARQLPDLEKKAREKNVTVTSMQRAVDDLEGRVNSTWRYISTFSWLGSGTIERERSELASKRRSLDVEAKDLADRVKARDQARSAEKAIKGFVETDSQFVKINTAGETLLQRLSARSAILGNVSLEVFERGMQEFNTSMALRFERFGALRSHAKAISALREDADKVEYALTLSSYNGKIEDAVTRATAVENDLKSKGWSHALRYKIAASLAVKDGDIAALNTSMKAMFEELGRHGFAQDTRKGYSTLALATMLMDIPGKTTAERYSRFAEVLDLLKKESWGKADWPSYRFAAQVARMEGTPREAFDRATEVAKLLEAQGHKATKEQASLSTRLASTKGTPQERVEKFVAALKTMGRFGFDASDKETVMVAATISILPGLMEGNVQSLLELRDSVASLGVAKKNAVAVASALLTGGMKDIFLSHMSAEQARDNSGAGSSGSYSNNGATSTSDGGDTFFFLWYMGAFDSPSHSLDGGHNGHDFQAPGDLEGANLEAGGADGAFNAMDGFDAAAVFDSGAFDSGVSGGFDAGGGFDGGSASTCGTSSCSSSSCGSSCGGGGCGGGGCGG